jgi:hypothetical protein
MALVLGYQLGAAAVQAACVVCCMVWAVLGVPVRAVLLFFFVWTHAAVDTIGNLYMYLVHWSV